MGWLCSIVALGLGACDDDDGSGVGASCASAAQCFVGFDEQLAGDPICLDKVRGGYCTHECDADSDCCSFAGECADERRQLCAPFEGKGKRMCFLSCEGQEDGDAFCSNFVHVGFVCRSSGGGSRNRKVCVPK